MDDRPQPGQAFMSALVTEHFVLQSAAFGLQMVWMYRRGQHVMA